MPLIRRKRTDIKNKGRAIARHMTKITGRLIEWVTYHDKGWEFQTTQYQTYKLIDIDGKITLPYITDNLLEPAPGCKVYASITCFPQQVDDGSLEYLIKKGLSQDLEGDSDHQSHYTRGKGARSHTHRPL